MYTRILYTKIDKDPFSKYSNNTAGPLMRDSFKVSNTVLSGVPKIPSPDDVDELAAATSSQDARSWAM